MEIMLKGTARIELTNVNSGEVEVIEKDNLITNALAHQISIFSTMYSYSDFNEKFCPVAENIMGGIKLFDNTIEEDPNNYFHPNIETHNITGYASAGSTDGTDPRRGSRNQLESQAIAGGYQFVWDFATSEANGTISSLAIVPSLGGEVAWFPHAEEYGFMNTSFNACWLAEVNFDEGYFTTIQYSSYTIYVRKYRPYFNQLDLTHKICYYYYFVEETIPVSFPTSDTLYFLDGGDNYWYALVDDLSSSGTGSIYIAKLHKETYEFSYETMELSDIKCAYFTRYNCCVQDGCMYLPKCTSSASYVKGFYKINLTNHADISIIDFDEWSTLSYNYVHISPTVNGMLLSDGILFSNTAKEVFFRDYAVDNKYYYGTASSSLGSTKFNYYCNYHYFASHGVQIMARYYSSDYSRIYFDVDQNALMTINNLPEPIIKTAEKTMKIIYTITYVEETENTE